MTIEFLPLVILMLGLIYLTYKTGAGMFQLFAGLIALYMTVDYSSVNGADLLTLVFALLSFFLLITSVRGFKL